MPSIFNTTNLKNITDTNPVIIDAIATFSEYHFQNNDRIINVQKIAEIPDHSKIIIKKIFLFEHKLYNKIAIHNYNEKALKIIEEYCF